MTKTEYAQYLASEDWRQRRKELIQSFNSQCFRCNLPRWLASLIYDQDLHVHHTSYENLGNETWGDVEVLCRRCHEIETFRRSDFREIKKAQCSYCRSEHWNIYSDYCDFCAHLHEQGCDSYYFNLETRCGDPVWHWIIFQFAMFFMDDSARVQVAFERFVDAVKHRAKYEQPPQESDVR